MGCAESAGRAALQGSDNGASRFEDGGDAVGLHRGGQIPAPRSRGIDERLPGRVEQDDGQPARLRVQDASCVIVEVAEIAGISERRRPRRARRARTEAFISCSTASACRRAACNRTRSFAARSPCTTRETRKVATAIIGRTAMATTKSCEGAERHPPRDQTRPWGATILREFTRPSARPFFLAGIPRGDRCR